MSSPALTIDQGVRPTPNPVARILVTGNNAVVALVRVVLGTVMFAHGAQKALGWFGGPGFSGTVGYFTGALHIPGPFAVLAVLAEFVGGIALIAGAFGRVAAFAVATNMVVAVLMVHRANGFFMNWSGQQAGEGFEYHLLVLALALVVMVRGSGALSVDRLLVRDAR